MSTDNTFELTDGEIFFRYHFHPFTPPRAVAPVDTRHSFAPFEHPELIKALYDLNYRKAYRLLRDLTKPLPPEEAAAACLCAALGSDKLLNAVLDHCPPIPEFQYKGVGRVAHLISIIVEFDLDKKLRILLRRGADPNGHSNFHSPLEIAFLQRSYAALFELLHAPGLEIELTEPILDAWGHVSVSPDAEGNLLLFQWCCQLLCEKLNPKTAEFPGILPSVIPPQLRPRHALAHNNELLAAKICDTNFLTEEDLDDLHTHFDGHFPPPTNEYCPFTTEKQWHSYTTLLKAYLRHVPNDPDDFFSRRAIACAAAGTPTPDDDLLAAAAQLTDGPVHLKPTDIFYLSDENCLSFAYFLLETFLSQWKERLGDRLPPALDLGDLTPELIGLWDSNVFLRDLTFTGSIAETQWNEFLPVLLHKFHNDDRIDQLLQPGKILSRAPKDKLLALLPQLPLKQRAVVLLHINQSSDYDL